MKKIKIYFPVQNYYLLDMWNIQDDAVLFRCWVTRRSFFRLNRIRVQDFQSIDIVISLWSHRESAFQKALQKMRIQPPSCSYFDNFRCHTICILVDSLHSVVQAKFRDLVGFLSYLSNSFEDTYTYTHSRAFSNR